MKRLFVFLAVLLLASCSAPSEKAATTTNALTGLPQAGFVPLPINTEKFEAAPTVPVPKTPLSSSWQGSLGDLIAADALSACMSTGTGLRNILYVNMDIYPLDPYLHQLISWMKSAACHQSGTKFSRKAWTDSREDPRCNVNTLTGQPEGLPERQADNNGKFKAAISSLFRAGTPALTSVNYAELNLCVAMHLKEALNSSEALLISDDEQGNLLGIVRERAQLATIGYAQIGQIIRSTQPEETDIQRYLGKLQTWALDPNNAQHVTYLGENFALATQLLIEATNEYARYLRRHAAMADAGAARSLSIWGEGSPRSRLMNLLFGGGDPMGPLTGDLKGGRAYGGRAWMRDAPPAFVKTSMRNPQVQALLQLARTADALYLRDLQGPAPKIDVEASAARLYRHVEQHLQKKACEHLQPPLSRSSPDPACGDAAMWALVPPLDQYSKTLAWSEHEIKPEHASKLVAALSEAVGELGLRPRANPHPPLYEGLFHLLGTHGRGAPPDSAPQTEPWLHIDPAFAIAPFSASELSVQYTRPFLPFLLHTARGSVHPADAGFFRWEPVGMPAEMKALQSELWEDQRQAGVVTVLEFVRSAIQIGRGLPYFLPSASIPKSIVGAIGERSVSIAPIPVAVQEMSQEICNDKDEMAPCTRHVLNGTYRPRVSQPDLQAPPMLASSGHNRLLQTVAISPTTTTFGGLTSAALPTGVSMRSSSYPLQGYRLHSTDLTDTPGSTSDLFLVDGTGVTQTYTPIFRTGSPGTIHIAFGGSFGQMAEQVMAVSAMDWSEPRYDAFGLLSSWLPPADASIIGGQPGEESYSFYLKAAKEAATQATTAVKTAIDNVTQEAIEKQALETSEQKAKGVAELTKRGLCGESLSCDVGQAFLYNTEKDDHYTGSSSECPSEKPATSLNSSGLNVGGPCPKEWAICYYPGSYCGCGKSVDANLAVSYKWQCHTNPPYLEPKASELSPCQGSLLYKPQPFQTDAYVWLNYGPDRNVRGLRVFWSPVEMANFLCEDYRSKMRELMGLGRRLAFPVWAASGQEAVPSFDFGGSKLQGKLMRQWNAVRLLRGKYAAFLEATNEYGIRLAAAHHEVDAEHTAKNNHTALVYTKLGCTACTPDDYATGRCKSADTHYCPCAAAAATGDPNQIRDACTALGANGVHVPLVDSANDYFQLGISQLARNQDLKIKEDLQCRVEGGQAPWQPGSAAISAREALMRAGCGASAACAAAESAKWACEDAFKVWSTSVGVSGNTSTDCTSPDGMLTAACKVTEIQTLLLKKLGFELLAVENEKFQRLNAYETRVFDMLKTTRSVNTEVAAAFTELLDLGGVINETNEELAQLKTDADAADSTAALDTEAAEINAKTRFALRRAFNSYDMWRARALIDSARVMSLAARRAIETRFVVNLADISTDQPFVKAPAQWADEVYQTDLDAPSSVGLTVGTPQTQGGIYPNKLLDYVQNLERFVQGYATEYPTSIAAPDSEILTLPGPEQYRALPHLTPVNPGGRMLELTADSKGWSFFCETSGKWIAHPLANSGPFDETAPPTSLSAACDGVAPTRARYPFMLNPWGVQQSPFGRSQTYANRYNVRWRRLGVNLVGTGVRDCGQAQDTLACYSSGFVRYSLNHTGPAWLTDYQEEWRSQLIPRANIEGAKALAAEEWLDPVTRAWNLPAVASIGRGELAGRPTSGVYDLILELGSDVRPDRIERIQLLTEYDYWVANGRSSGGSSAQ